MKDLIRMMAMKCSRVGTCNKCGQQRENGNHNACDRWPTYYGSSKGFHYVANSQETTLKDLKDIVQEICQGEARNTPVRFEIRIMQTRNVEEDVFHA